MDEILNPEGLADQFESPENEQKDKIIIKAIGVGGGGGNAVNYMFRQGIQHVSFVVLNTDRQALRQSPVPTKVMIGDGLGAGDRPEVAREAAENDIAKIEALFQDDTRMVFITSGMGGGTGTGASPVVARVARERGLLTIGIVTIPFYFEGEEKINKAFEGADEMAKYVDALLLINNERLTEIYGDLDFINGFGKADDTLATAARSISELITCDGYMNLDFNDVNTTLRDGGAAIISSGYGDGENRVTKALEDALASPLLKHRDISTAKRLLFNIYFSQDATNKFKLSEVNELTSFVQKINPKVKIIWGVAFDKELGEQIKITMLASGFDVDRLGEIQEIRNQDQPEPFSNNSIPVNSAPAPRASDRIREEYGEKVDTYRTNYIILKPDEMDSDTIIEVLEKSPTYNRDRATVEQARAHRRPQTMTQQRPSGGFTISFT